MTAASNLSLFNLATKKSLVNLTYSCLYKTFYIGDIFTAVFVFMRNAAQATVYVFGPDFKLKNFSRIR